MKHRYRRPQQGDIRHYPKATSQHLLHVDRVQPSIELVTDLVAVGRLIGLDGESRALRVAFKKGDLYMTL